MMSPEPGRVLISTVPFGDVEPESRRRLDAAGAAYTLNPLGRKLTESELAELIGDFSVLVAGTEPITERVMDAAPLLRLIARVGIGLDNVDLIAARDRGIVVTYTPDAPAPAVAELTIGLMLSLLRFVPQADRSVRQGEWRRFIGRRLEGTTVGIVGLGRVGQRVVRHLGSFGARVVANDVAPDTAFAETFGVEWREKTDLYRESDIVTLHLPLTPVTRGFIGAPELALMKPGALLINTARGNLLDEKALAAALRSGHLAGAALDVFAHEPYLGELQAIDNCILTSHLGSMSVDCRGRMEREAAEEVVRFLMGKPPLQPAPINEVPEQGGASL